MALSGYHLKRNQELIRVLAVGIIFSARSIKKKEFGKQLLVSSRPSVRSKMIAMKLRE
jgi:hypothetical protein